MLKVSALLSLLESHLKIYAAINQPVPADTVVTITRLLSSCREHAIDMEAKLYPASPESEAPAEPTVSTSAPALNNIIHLNFPSAGSPTAPEIA